MYTPTFIFPCREKQNSSPSLKISGKHSDLSYLPVSGAFPKDCFVFFLLYKTTNTSGKPFVKTKAPVYFAPCLALFNCGSHNFFSDLFVRKVRGNVKSRSLWVHLLPSYTETNKIKAFFLCSLKKNCLYQREATVLMNAEDVRSICWKQESGKYLQRCLIISFICVFLATNVFQMFFVVPQTKDTCCRLHSLYTPCTWDAKRLGVKLNVRL